MRFRNKLAGCARFAPLVLPAVLALSLPVARADALPVQPASPRTRLVLAMRLGLEAAFGHAEEPELVAGDMRDYAPLTAPVALSVLAQFPRGFELGGGLTIAPGFEHPAGDAPRADAAHARARALVARTGLELARHFRPQARFDPWIGAGLSAEILRYTAAVGQTCASNGDCYRIVDVKSRYVGLPELSLLLGVDYGGDAWRVGPVLRVGGGAFAHVHRSYRYDDPERGLGEDNDIYRLSAPRAWHGAVFVGVRGSFRR